MDPWFELLQKADGMLTQHRLAAFREFLHAHRSRCPCLTTEGAVCMVGYIVNLSADHIQLQRKPFVPWEGFVTSVDSADKVGVIIPSLSRRPIKLQVGSEIIIYGKVVEGCMETTFVEDVIHLHRPCLDRDLPFNALHLFAGGYCGWTRALSWLHDHVEGISCGSQVSVDADPMVLEAWSEQHGYQHYVGATHALSTWDPTEHIGICTAVQDKTCLRRCLWPTNTIATVSPPCVSWSRGGKREGLNCTPGFAAFDAVQTLEVQQPLLIFLECADEVMTHDHFELFKAALRIIGYDQVWQQVVPLNNLTHNSRTRWLAVWRRKDSACDPIHATVIPRAPPLTWWNSDLNKFWVPDCIREQLILDQHALSRYGDPQMLPPAKRARLQSGTCNEVLTKRIPPPGEPLPTLCSSYTTQHHLDADHISEKGIFACLVKCGSDFEFLSPLTFVPLLGTTDRIVLPCSVAQAFHLLGNSIAQPHALLALSIGFIALKQTSVTLSQIIRDAWNDRMTSANAIVHRHESWVTVEKFDEFLKNLDFRYFLLPNPEKAYLCVRLTKLAGSASRDTSVPTSATLHDAVRQTLSFSEVDEREITFVSTECNIPGSSNIDQVLRQHASVLCKWRESAFAELSRGGQLFSEVIPPEEAVVSATIPFTAREETDDIDIVCASLTFEQIRQTPTFIEALSFVEQHYKNMRTTEDVTISAALAWERPAMIYNIQIVRDDPIGCLQSLLDQLFPRKYQVYISPVRLPRVANGPLLLVREFDRSSDALVIITTSADAVGIHVKSVPRTLSASTKCVTPVGEHRLVMHNYHPIVEDRVYCHTGDILTVAKAEAPVLVGGHHTTNHVDPLPAGASFSQRADFATQTHGWAASDEILACLTLLQQLAPEFLQSFGIQLWRPGLVEFEEGPFGEMHFAPNGLSCLVLLVGSHWALVQVTRRSNRVRISVSGLSQSDAQRVALITCRLLDVAPHRAQLTFDFVLATPHMCGWTLLFRLFAQAEALDYLPDQSYLWSILTPNEQQVINQVQAAAQTHWLAASQDAALRGFAYNMRLQFFIGLALQARHVDAVTAHPIQVSFGPIQADTGSAPSSFEFPRSGLTVPSEPTNRDGFTQTNQDDRILQRLQACIDNPGWLFSDTLDYLLDRMRDRAPHFLFAPPAAWNRINHTIEFYNDYKCDISGFASTLLFLNWDNHWIQCEIHQESWEHSIVICAPEILRTHCQSLAIDIAAKLIPADSVLRTHFVSHNPPMHVCGWTLLFAVFRRFGTIMQTPSPSQLNTLRNSPHAPWHIWIQHHAAAQWGPNIPQELRSFAATRLLQHLFRVDEGRFPLQYAAAGAVESKPKAAGGASVDPLSVNDPWARKSNPSRWEDLVLDKDHPFHDDKGVVLPQLHRLQVTGHDNGVILTTKQHLPDLAKLGTKATLVALLPQLDDASRSALGGSAAGPFEVILHDKAVQQTFKRVMHAVPISGRFAFTLREPACEFSTSEIAELVIELDSRLTSKGEFDSAAASPVSFFKDHIIKHVPTVKEQLTLYGFRHNHHPSASKGDDMLQIVIKVSKSARATLLGLSGTDSILIRDYLNKNTSMIDMTVIPRFWEINQKGLRELLISVQEVVGAAGVMLTRRGLAIRAWAKDVATVRKKILPSDPRLTETNLSVVPRLILDSSGWPAGAAASDIVEAVNKAVGSPPVPTRTFRSAGVHVWQLGFEAPPKVTDFTVKINGELFQILLTPSMPAEKGQGKGKSSKRFPKQKQKDEVAAPGPSAPAAAAFNPDRRRLDTLEAKFDSLQGQVTGIEKKQSVMETKLDSRFDDISNTLRQLLQMSASRSHEKTGETPPPKMPKMS